MPQYIYQNPKTKQTIEIVQSIHDIHEYTDKNGLKWNRVFTVPQATIPESMNAFTTDKEFIDKTKNKKGNYGDIMDRSKELSEQRKEKFGSDPIQKEYFNDWSKKRKGKKHPKSQL
jgi:hypothetical protein